MPRSYGAMRTRTIWWRSRIRCPCSFICSGPASSFLACARVTSTTSGSLNTTDAIYGLDYLFRNGPPPPPPTNRCGLDPTPDALPCDETPCGTVGTTVVISEIMASNRETTLDEDGDSSDWIELALLDSAPNDTLDLAGWYLTDNPDVLTKWQVS